MEGSPGQKQQKELAAILNASAVQSQQLEIFGVSGSEPLQEVLRLQEIME